MRLILGISSTLGAIAWVIACTSTGADFTGEGGDGGSTASSGGKSSASGGKGSSDGGSQTSGGSSAKGGTDGAGGVVASDGGSGGSGTDEVGGTTSDPAAGGTTGEAAGGSNASAGAGGGTGAPCPDLLGAYDITSVEGTCGEFNDAVTQTIGAGESECQIHFSSEGALNSTANIDEDGDFATATLYVGGASRTCSGDWNRDNKRMIVTCGENATLCVVKIEAQ
jgi:hypothetical protein